MSVLGYLLSGSHLKKAKNFTVDAREAQGEKADQLFQQAYDSFASVSESFSRYADTLYYWGFALMHQAMTKSSDEAIKLFEEANNKYSFCQTISPNHLGAAVDGGVALLGLAKIKQVDLDNELYSKAKASFESAETIQIGSASYNLACMFALLNEGDACLKALENARDHGLVPDQQNIVTDEDLNNVKQLPWFAEYIDSLTELEVEESESESESENDKKATDVKETLDNTDN